MPETYPEPDIAYLCKQATEASPAVITTHDVGILQSCVFTLRRLLIEALLNQHACTSVQQEEALQDALPPLVTDALPFTPYISPLRQSCMALLGFFFGLSIVQLLLAAHAAVTPAGFVGAACFVYAGNSFFHNYVQKHSPQKMSGTQRLLHNALRWWLWVVIFVLAVLRDFWAGNDPVSAMHQALMAFTEQGSTLPLFTNIYVFILWAWACVRCFDVPKQISREALVQHLTLAARNWWIGASYAAETLLGNTATRRAAQEEQWRKMGQELYSLAHELDPAKGAWLRDKLRLLGLTAPKEQGRLLWEESLATQYEPLGHIAVGDVCYVDTPPLFENNVLLRKGIIRKVRQA